MKQYVVKVDIGYKHVEFVFDSVQLACHFMEMFLDHIMKSEDGDEVNVCMERINLPIKEEE